MSGLLASTRLTRKLFGRGGYRPPGTRTEPDRIVLAPEPGVTPSPLPPVRIFVGTEPGQYRSERVFVWSVARRRDPARAYEIYLMRDLVGFDRRRWLTGFTNYRFAIPHFAGNHGRAIYNDVDQIYLGDPAGLFDIDMGGHGFLALSDKDTSVMLMDCARMGAVWKLDDARRERRKAMEAKARGLADAWGPLPRQWHARDEEYEPGRSRVLHFTTIHTQPWQPFPDHFVYLPNPVGHVWLDLEREALAHGFEVFTRTHPSPRYAALRERVHAAGAPPSPGPPGAEERVRAALREAGARRVLQCGLGPSSGDYIDLVDLCPDLSPVPPPYQGRGQAEVGATGAEPPPNPAPGAEPPPDPLLGKEGEPEARRDAVVCLAGLERIPEEDVPWVIDTLFAFAGRLLHVEVDDRGAPGEPWWTEMFVNASRRHPSVRWQLVVQRSGRVLVREGGRRLDGRPPAVWVIADDKLGHTTQGVGLAEALGWPHEVKPVRFNRLQRLSNRLLGATLLSVDQRRSATLSPPWPDVVIATGRRAVPVGRWIARQSGGRTRVVQLGRKGAERADNFDLSVSCAHFGLPEHPRRIEILAPLTAMSDERLREAGIRWRDLFAGRPRPHVALLVGGTSAAHELDAETAERMAREVARVVEAAGGSLYVLTSPRTGSAATTALRVGLGDRGALYEWKPNDPHNPYLGALAVADALIVTGDSESMLAEAATTGKPLSIFPLPVRRNTTKKRARARVRRWVSARAVARPRKEKGTVRPQQGLEYVCARLLERGLVRPPRDLEAMHERLIAAGYARPFGAALNGTPGPPLRELDRVAERVRALLGVQC